MFEEAIRTYLQAHRFGSLDLKAVLFDMDGVLFDSMKNHAAAWHEAMKRYNLQMSPEEAYLHEGRTGADTNFQFITPSRTYAGRIRIITKNKRRRINTGHCHRFRSKIIIGTAQ